MKSFELEIKFRKTYYDDNEDTKTWISFGITDLINREHIMPWFDGGILDYVSGFLEIKCYGKLWVGGQDYRNFPIYQLWELANNLDKVLNRESFAIPLMSTNYGIFFDELNHREYQLYLAKKHWDLDEALEVGLYKSKEEYDNKPKESPIIVKKQDVIEELILKGIELYEILKEIDVPEHRKYHEDNLAKYMSAYEKL
jgi:hypothetical protein